MVGILCLMILALVGYGAYMVVDHIREWRTVDAPTIIMIVCLILSIIGVYLGITGG